jgi:uncharacterized protein (TIGR03435 family)
MAWRRLVLEAERACDDAALVNTDRTAYAEQLLRTARRLHSRLAGSAPAMASRSDLAVRIAAVLDPNQRRGRAGTLGSSLTAAIGLIVVLVVSPVFAVATNTTIDKQSESRLRLLRDETPQGDDHPIPANRLSPVGIAATASRPGMPIRSAASAAATIGPVHGPTASPAQQTNATPLAFTVASVKPNPAGVRGLHRGPIISGTEFTWTGALLRWLIMYAYQLDTYRVLGGLEWMNSGPNGDYFDIEATAPVIASPDQFRLMLRKLLAERFNLVVHTETRDTPVYELVVDNPNGRLGPGLRHSDTDCATRRAAAGPDLERSTNPCGINLQIGHSAALGMGMAVLASWLSRDAGRLVVDKTGLDGVFDFDLVYTPEPLRHHPPDRFPQVDPEGPSIFTAVQEQLGLKLEPQEHLGDVLIVDRAEHPTPD